jgi:putative ubiquitin-RnfH superfamily antitoxin RatB of RatAB toxin-antitoxin module
VTSGRKSKLLRVEVVYALRDRQALVRLDMREGATVRQAISDSGVLREFPEIDLARAVVGIFGKVVPLDTPLTNGDRIEIYRPLAADPKEMRRQRVSRRPGPRRS